MIVFLKSMGLLSFADAAGAAYPLLQRTDRSLGAARTAHLANIITAALRASAEDMWLCQVF